MTARAMLEDVGHQAGEQEVALSVVTVLELAHGVARADTAERRSKRQRFLDEPLRAVPVQPVTVPIALLAGRIDGEQQSKGTRIALADLLIGASALELGYQPVVQVDSAKNGDRQPIFVTRKHRVFNQSGHENRWLYPIFRAHCTSATGCYAVGTANARHFQLIPGLNVLNL